MHAKVASELSEEEVEAQEEAKEDAEEAHQEAKATQEEVKEEAEEAQEEVKEESEEAQEETKEAEEEKQLVGLKEKINSHVKAISEKVSNSWKSLSPSQKRAILIIVIFLLVLIIIIPTSVMVSNRSSQTTEANGTEAEAMSNKSRGVEDTAYQIMVAARQMGKEVIYRSCEPNPCENNGTCVSENDDYACKCQNSYQGIICEIRSDGTESISNRSEDAAELIMLPHMQMADQGLINYCESNPCENNGTCFSGNDDYACKCQVGYYGRKCEIRSNLCNSSPCKNNATCISGNDNFACECQEGYYGIICDKKNNLCDSNPCENNGTCVSGNNEYACNCLEGYYGNNCENKHSICDSNPCRNKGECIAENNDYTCNCQCGFSGKNCLEVVKPGPEPGPEPGWYLPGNGYQYILTTQRDDAYLLRTICNSMGADLAVQGMKNLTLRRLIANTLSDGFTHAWIGLDNLVGKNTFTWADGTESANNAHWDWDQPDDRIGFEYCTVIQTSADYLTHDYRATNYFPAICEKRVF